MLCGMVPLKAKLPRRAKVRDKLYDVTDVEQMFRLVSGRKDWKKMPSTILLRLIENARAAPTFPNNPQWSNPAVMLLQRFVELSEVFGLVHWKWTLLTKKWSPEESPAEVLSYFSAILEDLAFQLFDEATNNIVNGKRTRDFGPRFRKTVEEARTAGQPELVVYLSSADIAYQLAIVCAPLNLANYVSLAGFYFAGLTQTSKSWAGEVCLLFDQAEEKLLKTADDALTVQDRLLKEDHNSLLTNLRENIRSMRTQLSNSTG
jgi:hypothetical protein